MWDWESSSVPYRPIQRRRRVRRRVLALGIILAVAIPYWSYLHHRNSQTVGERVFDEVVQTVSLRYFDAGYHGVAWRTVTQRYRLRVVNAPSIAARYRALRAMLAQLHDSHTSVYSPDELAHVGELKLTADTRAEARVLQTRALHLETPHARGLRARALDAPSAADVDWKTIAPGVGYLRIASFPDSVQGELTWALTDIGHNRALILDLRGNPGGLVDSVDAVAGAFLPQGTLISSGTRRYRLLGTQRFTAADVGVRYDGRVVVLVDRNSRSGAESLARALQYYHRATLVGTRTAGKVLGVDAEIALDDGGLLRVATLDMYAPDGRRLEGRGVTPEIFAASPQAQLDAALRLVADQSQAAPTESQPNVKSLGAVSACPVSIHDFSESGIGSTQHMTEYRIGIRATGHVPMAANFIVSGDLAAHHVVSTAGVDAATDAVIFYWPSSALKQVGIASVELGGKLSECDPSDTVALTKRAPMISDKGAPQEPGEEEMPASMLAELAPMDEAARGYMPVFDDSTLALTGDGLALRDARVLKHVMPYYPDVARESGAEGDALVSVVVGPKGAVVRADVVRSNAGPTLNGEVLTAARRTPYSEPLLSGTPSTRTYLMVMSFRLGGLTGLQFAGRIMPGSYSLPARFSINFL